jgi:diacylglycerol O-acyltransferase / wax synthase
MSGHHAMPAADVAWLHMDRPTNLMVVNVAQWFDTPVDWERVKAICRERLVERYSRFSQRLAGSRVPWRAVAWEDDPRFELEHHFHRLTLPAPGDHAALLELVGDLMGKPLGYDKPLWKMYLVEGYGSGCAIVYRVHHCIGDGIAISRVLMSLTDEKPDGAVAPAPPVDGRLQFSARRHDLGELMRAGKNFRRAVTKPPPIGSDADIVLKGELGVAQRVAATQPVRLDDVKRIADEAGATINDVMLSAVTGALRGYLRERGSAVAEIRASVPINLRPLSEPVPRSMGNKFGLALLTLPLGVDDPRKRLAEIHRRMADIKHSPEGAFSYNMLRVAGMMPLNVERDFIEISTARATAVITNVPGPPHRVYLAGTPVQGMLAWAPKPGSLSMSVTIFSYNGEITASLAADAGVIPDPERIVTGVKHELAELLHEAPRAP